MRAGVPDRGAVREGPLGRRDAPRTAGRSCPYLEPPREKTAMSQAEARHRLAGRLLRLPHVVPRPGRVADRARPSGPSWSTARWSTSRSTPRVSTSAWSRGRSPTTRTWRRSTAVRDRTPDPGVVRRLRRHRQRARPAQPARRAAAAGARPYLENADRQPPDARPEDRAGAAGRRRCRCTRWSTVDVFLPGCPPLGRPHLRHAAASCWTGACRTPPHSARFGADRRPGRGPRDRHRPRHPDRGPRQDHHPPRRRTARSPTPASTSPSSAASSASARAGRCTRCRSIMARICGICPVSHLIASAKAVRRDPGRRAARRPPSTCAG